MEGFFILLIGICIGSFLNVCIYRIPLEKSIVPSSKCMKCGYGLKWYDLIPIFSYLAVRGRCRKCAEPLSIQYPLVEVLNGVLYISLYMRFGMSITFVKYALIISIMLVLAFIDFNTQYVYSVVSWSALGVAAVFMGIEFYKGYDVMSSVYALALGVAIFAGINIFAKIVYKRQGLGGGDVEVIAAMGMVLGLSNFVLALFLSFIIGAVVSLVLMALKKIDKGSYLAFVPFLAAATFIAMMFGDKLIAIYMSFITAGL